MAQKLKSIKTKKQPKVSSKDTKTKVIKSSLSLKGNKKSNYVIKITEGDWSDDLQIKEEELYELYCLLERKFGEFI